MTPAAPVLRPRAGCARALPWVLALVCLGGAPGLRAGEAPARSLPRLDFACTPPAAPEAAAAAGQAFCAATQAALLRLGRYDVRSAADGAFAHAFAAPAPATGGSAGLRVDIAVRAAADGRWRAEAQLAQAGAALAFAAVQREYARAAAASDAGADFAAAVHDALLRAAAGQPALHDALTVSADGAALAPRRLRWTWLAGGVTLATAIAASIVSAEAASQEDKLQATLRRARSEPQPASLARTQADKAERQALAANVLWGLAGACAITTGVVFYLEYARPPAEPGERRRVTVAPAATGDGAALTLTGSF